MVFSLFLHFILHFDYATISRARILVEIGYTQAHHDNVVQDGAVISPCRRGQIDSPCRRGQIDSSCRRGQIESPCRRGQID